MWVNMNYRINITYPYMIVSLNAIFHCSSCVLIVISSMVENCICYCHKRVLLNLCKR